MIEPFYATFRVKSSAFLLSNIALFPFLPQWDPPKAFLLYKIEASFTTKNPGTFSRTGIFIR